MQPTAEQKKDFGYADVQQLRLSFKGLTRIDNLPGLTNLRDLRLDNNDIHVISNLNHLVRQLCMVHIAWVDCRLRTAIKLCLYKSELTRCCMILLLLRPAVLAHSCTFDDRHVSLLCILHLIHAEMLPKSAAMACHKQGLLTDGMCIAGVAHTPGPVI